MREYALKTLNMSEYTGIYLKKRSAEYARILNVSVAVHTVTFTAQIAEQLSRQRRIQNTIIHLRWNVLQKE